MTNLRFKEYTFRHNPRSLTVRSRRLTAQVSCFGLGQALQELGPGLTEVEGEGELFGTDAMEQFLVGGHHPVGGGGRDHFGKGECGRQQANQDLKEEESGETKDEKTDSSG